jgi:phosphoserine phosphatase
MPSVILLGSKNDAMRVHRSELLGELLQIFPGNIALSESRRADISAMYWHLPKDVSNLDPNNFRNRLIVLRNSLAKYEIDVLYLNSLLDSSKPSLFVFDMDSTLIQEEVIDELARMNGTYETVAKVTKDAMEGGLGFEESLRRRAIHLKGLPVTAFKNLYSQLNPNIGVPETLFSLKKEFGSKLAVLSGGFSPILEIFEKEYGIDFTEANSLEVLNEKLTGSVLGRIVGKERKRDILIELSSKWSIPKSQTVAIGDGANDGFMIGEAGIGVGFHAKKGLKEEILNWIDYNPMDSILLFFAPSL